MKKRRLFCCISFILVLCLCSGCRSLSFQMEDRFEDYYAGSRENTKESEAGMAEDLAVLSPEEDRAFNLSTGDYADLVINDSTNTVITSSHCFDKLYPASITKIMTALLTLEQADLTDTLRPAYVSKYTGRIEKDATTYAAEGLVTYTATWTKTGLTLIFR